MSSDARYNVYYLESSGEETLMYSDCTLIDMISARYQLTDDEVRKWFGIDENHRLWEKCHSPFPFPRYVFDRCIVPATARFRIEKEGVSMMHFTNEDHMV